MKADEHDPEKKCPVCGKVSEIQKETRVAGLIITTYTCGHVKAAPVRPRLQPKQLELAIVPEPPSREQEFQDRLLAAVNEVRRRTRHGVAAILQDIQGLGGLQAAKKRLCARGHAPPHQFLYQPSSYFLATKRVGRMELSIEALALEPKWQRLFTPGEIDEAAATLSEHGFAPALKAPTAPETSALVPIERQPSLARIRLTESRGGPDLAPPSAPTGRPSECEVAAKFVSALREGRCPSAHPMVRKHIGECLNCRDLYPDLISAFERFDNEVLLAWHLLLTTFQESMKLEDEQLFRFVPHDDNEEPGYYASDLDLIRAVCAWRAVRIGCQVGRFMSAFAGTFSEGGDLWLKWRKGESQGPIPTSIQAIDRQFFLLGLLARNLLLVCSWPSEDEGVLWVPSDEDLISVPGLVHLDRTRTVIDEWEEVLGQPSRDLNLLGILYLAHQAAVAEAGEFESSPNETTAARESREQWGRMEEMLRTIQCSQAEALERQDAIIGQMERMVLYMKSADRHTCEESLLAELPGVYEKLAPDARNLCLASEQVYRTPGFAAPGTIVHGLATAFELQLRHSVISGLFDHLKYRRVEKLLPLADQDAEQNKPLWRPATKADKCTLGPMKLILQHTHPAIEEFFLRFGLDRTEIQRALGSVYDYRNSSAHGECFDIGTAEAIRANWFHWCERPGGIFSVFFRNE
jgi:hypothetical protein